MRDDLDFLRYLPDRITPSDKLVTMDVTNLYTNITSTLGLEELNYWINTFPEKINNRFEKNFILEATELLLNNNTFVFNNRYLLQTNGYAPIPPFQFVPPKVHKTCDSIQFNTEDMHHSERRQEKESTSGRN